MNMYDQWTTTCILAETLGWEQNLGDNWHDYGANHDSLDKTPIVSSDMCNDDAYTTGNISLNTTDHNPK